MTGFLNRDGGIILIGVKEDKDKVPIVQGSFYNHRESEEVT